MAKENIGRYELEAEIGRGGMATVYLAHDPNFRRNVAIKLVAGNLLNEHIYRERFEREARLIARIEHPAIVPVYDFGEQDHKLYLVMRYMPGGSLAGRIKKTVLNLREAFQILSQIAPALDAVHAQGIIHRDLKPGNILFDSFGNPAISDFGIAHFTAATSDLTGSAVLGTPAYMSPEQIQGGVDLDGRTDIYALGVILFEMLSGRRPFQSKTPLSLVVQHLKDPVPSIRLIRHDLPVEVDRILNKAMAKDRDMRYSTAAELVQDLRSVLDSAPDHEVSPRVQAAAFEDAATEVDPVEDERASFLQSGTTELDIAPESRNSAQLKPSTVPLTHTSGPSARSGQPASRRLRILTMAGAGLLLLFFLCGSLGLLGTLAGRSLPGFFLQDTPTMQPTVMPTEAGDIQDLILLADDFSNPNSGWPAGQSAAGTYGYQPDGYHILVSGLNQVLWVSTERVYDDTSLFVDATPTLQGSNGYYGLLCRIQDDRNFYYFVIQENGSYTIGKYKDAVFGAFFPEGWRHSDAIETGYRTNRLQADCAGNTLRLTVNNLPVDEVTDPDFTSGFSGLVAASLNEQDFEVRFNNLLITKASR